MIRILLAGFFTMVAVLGLTVTGRAEQPGARVYASSQAISHTFGSKRAIGYFSPHDGACSLTMFLTEAENGDSAPSAPRIRFIVKPGDSAELASAEGLALEVTCGTGAAAVEVRQTALMPASATQ